MLAAEDVSFAYGAAPVLGGVSVRAAAGALVGILGPNGSGKTTLLRLLSGALVPQSGRVTLDDRPMTTFARRDLARRLAVVPQETQLEFDYTALEIVLMGRYAHLAAFEIEGPDDLAAADSALAETGMLHLASRGFRTLSGGEKQRVVIASALAQLDARRAAVRGHAAAHPILCLDEPTTALDLRHQLELIALLRRLNAERGLTVVLTTHDLRFAASVCSHLMLLAQGRVLAEGTPNQTLTATRVGALYEIDPAAAAPFLPR